MSTWIKEKPTRSWAQSFCENVLKCGHIPKHIAIIMDGNRRFAVKKKYERSVGHLLGFNKVAETIEWCSGLGVNEVTLYAFSLENFKRSKEEVDCLMELARQKFSALLSEINLVNKHGLCVRIIGNLSYLSAELQIILAKVIYSTRHNNKGFLNVCCAYTSQEEMTQSIKRMQNGVKGGWIIPSDIDETLFEKCLYTGQCSEPDILIRTSGEVRLSDFLLWQTSYSMLSFTPVLWPEFTKWHLYSFIILYQLNNPHLKKAKEDRTSRRRSQRRRMDIKVAKQLIKQFSMEVKDGHEIDKLDDLIKKLKINEDHEDDQKEDSIFNSDFLLNSEKLSDSSSTITATSRISSRPFDSAFNAANNNSTNDNVTTKNTNKTTSPLLECTEPSKISVSFKTTGSNNSHFMPPPSTNNTASSDTPEEHFERLLRGVVASRERRRCRFLEKLQSDYNDYITSILTSRGCTLDVGVAEMDGLKEEGKLDVRSEHKKNGSKALDEFSRHHFNGDIKL